MSVQLKKLQGGAEDLLFGHEPVSQIRAGQPVLIQPINASHIAYAGEPGDIDFQSVRTKLLSNEQAVYDESLTRAAADAALQLQIDELPQVIVDAEGEIYARIDLERDESIARDDGLAEAITNEKDYLVSEIQRVEGESYARDTGLDNKIELRHIESVQRDDALTASLANLQDFISGEYILSYPNASMSSLQLPYDLGDLNPGTGHFSNELMAQLRIDLAYGGATIDLGTVV